MEGILMALKNFFYNNMDTCKEQYTENRPMCPTKDIRYDIGCTNCGLNTLSWSKAISKCHKNIDYR